MACATPQSGHLGTLPGCTACTRRAGPANASQMGCCSFSAARRAPLAVHAAARGSPRQEARSAASLAHQSIQSSSWDICNCRVDLLGCLRMFVEVQQAAAPYAAGICVRAGAAIPSAAAERCSDAGATECKSDGDAPCCTCGPRVLSCSETSSKRQVGFFGRNGPPPQRGRIESQQQLGSQAASQRAALHCKTKPDSNHVVQCSLYVMAAVDSVLVLCIQEDMAPRRLPEGVRSASRRRRHHRNSWANHNFRSIPRGPMSFTTAAPPSRASADIRKRYFSLMAGLQAARSPCCCAFAAGKQMLRMILSPFTVFALLILLLGVWPSWPWEGGMGWDWCVDEAHGAAGCCRPPPHHAHCPH